jgi:chromosome segregation protein
MYLSKLEILGFKSFAQRVNLDFDSGISAIVGPNGCGKTNIVDAIRWVLGEQRYSALRSDKMEDVIFNGTKARKPLGMAEASLVIENTKGILPSEYTQVTVGRRVYRSGESEYLLNKAPCRLKDILDLFMDTGMGADAYSVIELKMIETILSDKTDERRRLFEEAAGVTKYKHRRKAAYRKLEAVQADLLRVNDIVTEVQKAVNSLERQARRAEQYNDVRTRVQTLEIDLMEREYAQLTARAEPLKEKFAAITADQSQITTGLTEDETRLETLRGTLLEVEKRSAEAQRDVGLQREKIHRVEERNLVAAERIRALRENIARLGKEQDALRREQVQLEAHRADLHQRLAEHRGQEAATQTQLQDKQEDLRAFEEMLDGKKSGIQALNGRTISLVTLIAEAQAEHERKKGQVENLRGRAAHASEEKEVYESEILRLDEEIAALTGEDRQHRRAFTEAEMRYYQAETLRNELLARIEEFQRKEVENRSSIERKRARVDFLKGLIESREGLSEGVRYLSASQGWNPSRKLTVADAVHAEERLRTAVEAALGEFAGLLVVDSAKDADQGMALLKQEERGKATFVSLDRIPLIQSRVKIPRLPGVIGWAVDLVQFDAPYAPLFRFILDRVLLVDSTETARQISAAVTGIRCVTLEGEAVSGVGIVRGGSRRQDEGGTIGKHRQIEELTAAIEEEEGILAETVRARDDVKRELDAIDLRALTEAVKNIEKEMNGVEMRIAQLEFEKKRAADIIAKNAETMTTLTAEAEALLGNVAQLEPGLALLAAEKGEVERALGASQQEFTSLEEERNTRSTSVNELGIALVTVRNELQNAQADLERTERNVIETRENQERNNREIDLANSEIATNESLTQENDRVIVGLREEHHTLSSRRQEIDDESARVRDEIHQRELRIKDRRRTHDDSLRQAHDYELKIADLRAKAEHLIARAKEEFEFALELKSYPDDEFVDFAKLREDIQVLRDKVKTLGNINFAAFEEYTTEKQRYEFLSSQRNDLIEAEKTLLATIEEINTTAQNKFLETFGLIRKNFIETFKSLFDPGDECDLRLEEDVDPLEARIEIVAKPRGKRPTSIDLLSGGEKTLTAIALLFAIYLVKPSPFCILDEVDAPLDDANIDRFTRILRKFSNNTQFIVVTHNKRTMEAASALYGVTMEEEGISKIVTVRFNQGAQVASAAVASA